MSGVDTSSSSVPSEIVQKTETQEDSCDNKMSETVAESSPSLENKEISNVPETESKETNELDNVNEENSINESVCGEPPIVTNVDEKSKEQLIENNNEDEENVASKEKEDEKVENENQENEKALNNASAISDIEGEEIIEEKITENNQQTVQATPGENQDEAETIKTEEEGDIEESLQAEGAEKEVPKEDDMEEKERAGEKKKMLKIMQN